MRTRSAPRFRRSPTPRATPYSALRPWILILLIFGIVQSTLLSHVTIFGVHPNLVLVTGVSWGLQRGGREGLAWGLVGGLILDQLSSAPFGTFTMAMLLTTFLTSMTELTLFRPTLFLPVAIMLLASPFFHLTALLVMQGLGWPVDWSNGLSLLLPAAAVDAALTIAIFPLVRRLSELAGARAIDWS